LLEVEERVDVCRFVVWNWWGQRGARCREWKLTVVEAGGGTLLYQFPIVFKYVGESE
jgi:hypothetical protein